MQRFRRIFLLLSYLTFFPKKSNNFGLVPQHFWFSAFGVRLAEHEKSSCHLQASVQWFEAEQRLTEGPRWIQVITFIICQSTKLSLCLAICEYKNRQKNTTSKSWYINVKDTPSSYNTEWKLQCGLTRQGQNCECHPAHPFVFTILGGYTALFHQSTMRIIYCIWYVFCTFCDVIVVKYF